MMRASYFIAIGAIMLLGAMGTTQAATFEYSGTVELCPDTGIPPCGAILFPGDTISGPIVVDGDVMPGTGFDFTAISSFAFSVGSFFAVTSDNSVLVGGSVDTNASGEIVSGYLAMLASAIDAPDALVTLDLSTSTWMAQALVEGVPTPVFIASGFGDFTRVVPVPAGILLLLPALGMLGLLRRR